MLVSLGIGQKPFGVNVLCAVSVGLVSFCFLCPGLLNVYPCADGSIIIWPRQLSEVHGSK